MIMMCRLFAARARPRCRSTMKAARCADETPPGLKAIGGPGSFSAIGDFNNDKKPDLVLVQNFDGPVSVSIWDVANDKRLFGPYPFQGNRMGPPTVADFDGDGRPDFAAAGADAYRVFSTKCVPKKAGCAAEGVLWEKVTQDKSSGVTGSSVFDFNGDRRAEHGRDDPAQRTHLPSDRI